jgi:hypothetical protein
MRHLSLGGALGSTDHVVADFDGDGAPERFDRYNTTKGVSFAEVYAFEPSQLSPFDAANLSSAPAGPRPGRETGGENGEDTRNIRIE